MSFKDFFINKVINGFFISVTFICIGIAVVGSAYDPGRQLPYNGFLAPIIFGLASSLPTFVMYSKRELSVREVLIRKMIHLILLEMTVNGILFITGGIKSISVLISLVLTIFIIDVAVNLVIYINDLRSAETINRGIKEIQMKNR